MRRVSTFVLLGAWLAALPLGAESLDPENLRTRCGEVGTIPVCEGPTCGTCQGCHSSHFLNSGPGQVRIGGLPDPYIPGTQYPLTVFLEDPTNPDFAVGGFQVSALSLYDFDADTVDELCQAGTFDAIFPGTQVGFDAATSTQWMEHDGVQDEQGTGQAIWDFFWTAPSPSTGIVTFNVCAVAADDQGDTAVDWVYCDEVRVLPDVLPCPTFSIDADASSGPGDCEVAVTWTPSGQISPVVYYVTVSVDGGPFEMVADCQGLVDVTECVHTPAPWGSDLVYRVEGTDSCANGPRDASSDTPPVQATDATPPVFSAPATQAAAGGADPCEVTVTWDPTAAIDACSGVAGYRAYRSAGTDSCPTGSLRGEVLDPAASSLLDTVVSDDDYFYWVRAVDAAGNEEANCVTDPAMVSGCIGTCPELTVTLQAASGPGDCEVSLTWQPTGNEGSTSYDLEYRRGPNPPWRDVPGCTGLVDVTSCRHAGAPWGQDLYYRITATDSCPQGPRVAEDMTLTPVQTTDATPPVFDPAGLGASSARCDVTLSWVPGDAADACSGLDGWRLYRADPGGACPGDGVLVEDIGDPGASGTADTVADIGDWVYWIRAYDRAGNEETNCAVEIAEITGCNVAEPWFLQGDVAKDALGGVVTLAWSESADSFNLYRGPLELTEEVIAFTGAYEQVECRVPGNAATDAVLDDGGDWFYLVVPVVQDREQGYGCTETTGDGLCAALRLESVDPCP